MIQIEFTKQEILAIITLLERTQLTGKEASSFIAIITKFMSALRPATSDKKELIE